MGGQSQPLPSYSKYESEILNLPPEQTTYKNALDIAIKRGFPKPYEAANEVIKKADADRKRIKESLPEQPKQPTGTVPLDVPLAQSIKDVTGGRMNYLQAAPIQSPLGMQGNLPIGIEDLLALLPQDYQLPSPIQGQQSALSFFGPQALGELPQQVTQPYIPSDVSEKVMSALTRQPDIASFPSGMETRTVLRDPITGRPMEKDIATAPREILTPQQAAFSRLTLAEQKQALLNEGKTQVNINMAEDAFMKEFGKETVVIMKKDREDALSAASGLGAIQEARKQLRSGVYSGAGANIKLNFNRWLQTAGLNINGNTVSNTEAYAAATGALVGKIIKQFGAGTGLSDADREYATRMAGGEITLNQASMQKILDISERAFKAQVKYYNKNIEKIKQKNPKMFDNIPYDWSVEEPITPADAIEELRRRGK